MNDQMMDRDVMAMGTIANQSKYARVRASRTPVAVCPAKAIPRDSLIWRHLRLEGGRRGHRGPFWAARPVPGLVLCPCYGVWGPVPGRLAPGPHPVRARARPRINQFAEANSMFRWFRFFAMPR